MARYLLTHSLLRAWLYAIKGNPYEDATTERDYGAEFMSVLRREPVCDLTPMTNGNEFESLVTAITEGGGDTANDWYEAAAKVAQIVDGSLLQVTARKEIQVDGMDIVLYGRLDALGAGVIRDIKFSKVYERGKYRTSTQHPTYLEIVPEATCFEYVVSNGQEVWTERYEREETPSIYPIIADFLTWLRETGHMALYKEKWLAK